MKKLFTYFFCSFLLFPQLVLATDESSNFIESAEINLKDTASLQRGAKWFMNYCFGCHSLRYIRYNQLAPYLGITDKVPKLAERLIKENLVFTNAKLIDPIRNAMSATDAKTWFGIVPPDLTLEARVRGVDWIYSFLKNFYSDQAQIWGVNNLINKDVAMPNVLVNLQGEQEPVFRVQTRIINGKKQVLKSIDHLVIVKPGSMSPEEFDLFVRDIVNFLAFVAEPSVSERERLGVVIIIFMFILAIFAYLLKRLYWRDIK